SGQRNRATQTREQTPLNAARAAAAIGASWSRPLGGKPTMSRKVKTHARAANDRDCRAHDFGAERFRRKRKRAVAKRQTGRRNAKDEKAPVSVSGMTETEYAQCVSD